MLTRKEMKAEAIRIHQAAVDAHVPLRPGVALAVDARTDSQGLTTKVIVRKITIQRREGVGAAPEGSV